MVWSFYHATRRLELFSAPHQINEFTHIGRGLFFGLAPALHSQPARNGTQADVGRRVVPPVPGQTLQIMQRHVVAAIIERPAQAGG
jgi:hypothetical protein